MNRYICNNRIINATERAFKVIYKQQGFKEITNLNKLTMNELKVLAKKKGIENYSTIKKDELIEALKGGNQKC